MANHLGREGSLQISATTVGELRNYALSHTFDTVEDTTLGDTYRTRKPTLGTWSLNSDLYWDELNAGQIALTVGQTVTVALYPEGTAATSRYYTGQGIVTKFDISAEFDGMVEGSITVEGASALQSLTA
jgi:hypothetical protein